MSRRRRVLVLGAQVPFSRGGAEALVESLCRELDRRGFESEIVQLPFAWTPRESLAASALSWRLLDLTHADGAAVDLVIATRFPTYAARHPNKVVWLVHQFRQIYDLARTRYSDFGSGEEDRATVDLIRRIDRKALTEARRIYTISGNTAERLQQFLDLEGTPLYPPSPLAGTLRGGEPGDYLLSVGRLDELKRVDLLIQALARTQESVRLVVAGAGPERQSLERLAEREGVASRVEFRGRVSDEELRDLYARARAVVYIPYDEDYGYVTVEAFEAGKAVVTCEDSGGVLEFVEPEGNGLVVAPEARSLGGALDRLWRDPETAARLGATGAARVNGIDWDHVIGELTATL